MVEDPVVFVHGVDKYFCCLSEHMLDQSNNTHIFLTRWRLINLCLPFLLTILIEDSIGMVGMAGEIRIFSNFVVDIGGGQAPSSRLL